MSTSLSQLWALVALCYHASQAAEGTDTVNLTFMLITSNGRYGFNSSGTLPAADIALERINNRSDVLPGYNLVYDSVRNSEVYMHGNDFDLCRPLIILISVQNDTAKYYLNLLRAWIINVFPFSATVSCL